MWDLLGSGIKSIVSCIGTRILYHWENFFKEPHSSLQLGEHWPSMPGAVHIVKAMVFPVVMYKYELDHKEG